MFDTTPQWTQDEAIAFECATECITDMIGIYMGEIYAEPAPTEARQEELRAEVARLATERRELHLHDHAEIWRIRRDYGQRIRDYRSAGGTNASGLPMAINAD